VVGVPVDWLADIDAEPLLSPEALSVAPLVGSVGVVVGALGSTPVCASVAEAPSLVEPSSPQAGRRRVRP